MATLTLRIPDDKHARLRELARRRRISINKLFEELSTAGLAEFDAETRFRAMAARGSVARKKTLAGPVKMCASFDTGMYTSRAVLASMCDHQVSACAPPSTAGSTPFSSRVSG